jgi:hypothetical protein
LFPTGQFAFKLSAKLTRSIFQGAGSNDIDKRGANAGKHWAIAPATSRPFPASSPTIQAIRRATALPRSTIAPWFMQLIPAIVFCGRFAVKDWFSSKDDHSGAARDPIMQFHQANTLEEIESPGPAVGNEVLTQPASMAPWDFLSPNRDEVLALLKPGGDRKRAIWLAAGALAAGFGLGWAGGFSWYGPANRQALNPVTQIETPPRRIAEIKSGGKSEGARKTASVSGSQTPQGTNTVFAAGASPAAKPQAASPGAANLYTGSSNTAYPAIQASMTPTERAPIVAAPETRPTTIEGWTVLDVRGGTAVLEGPDGVRMATRGDTVAGIGRIDSIVRWGNRWIVATASGLIATP